MNLPLVYKTYGRSLFIKLLLLAATLLLIPMLSDLAHAQRQNTRYADQFDGVTVAAKVTAAQNACLADVNVPCVIIIDTNLFGFPEGALPTRCTQCAWLDFRVTQQVRFGVGIGNSLVYIVPNTIAPFTRSGISSFADNAGGIGNGGDYTIGGGTGGSVSGNGGNVILQPGSFNGSGANGDVVIKTGILPDASGVKHKIFGATTATAAAVGATADTAYTWTTSFADNSYEVNCQLLTPTNVPVIVGITTQSASGFTLRIAALTAAAASAANVYCQGYHQ